MGEGEAVRKECLKRCWNMWSSVHVLEIPGVERKKERKKSEELIALIFSE